MVGAVMKMAVIGGVLSIAMVATVAAVIPQGNQSAQIHVSEGFLDDLQMMNETERLLMFTNLTPEQEAAIKTQEGHCESLAVDNNHTAISQFWSCSNSVGERAGIFQAYNLREMLAVVNQTIALSGHTYTQTQTEYIRLDCLWDEIGYYYLTEEMAETCRIEIQSYMRGG